MSEGGDPGDAVPPPPPSETAGLSPPPKAAGLSRSQNIKLAVVQLQGNAFVPKVSQYRRNTVAKLRALSYLDDRPVFEEERVSRRRRRRARAARPQSAPKACAPPQLAPCRHSRKSAKRSSIPKRSRAAPRISE